MLQNIRDKSKGWGTWLIVGAVAAGFIGMGASSYISSSVNKGQVVATVDGKDITTSELDAAYKNIKQQMANNPLSSNDGLIKAQALGQLIEHYALLNNIQSHGFYVSTEQTDQVLRTLPVFQVNGEFSQSQYDKVLQRFGYTTNQLRADISQQMLVNQLNQGLMKSAFALKGEVMQFTQLINQKRSIGYFKVTADTFMHKVSADQKEIDAYYKQHQKEFITPEKVRINAIVLSLADFQKNTQVSEQEIKDYYQQHIERYTRPLQRHFAVLDFPLSQTDVKAIEKARNDAKAALEKAQQGTSFAALIKDYDLKSNNKTGEWGWFSQNQFPPTVSDPLFTIKKTGDVILLERPEMLQVVKLLGVRPARTTPLSDVSAEISKTLLAEKAQAAFSHAVEKLKSLQAQYPNDLEKIAAVLKVKMQISPWFDRDEGQGIAQNTKVLTAAFSDEVLQQDTNSAVLRLDDQHAVVIHLAEHQAAKLQPLSSVKTQITTAIQQEKAQKMAKAQAEKIQQQLKTGTSYRQLTQQFNVTWHQLDNLSRQSKTDPLLVKAAFAMPTPTAQSPSVTVTAVPEQGYLVTQLLKVTSGKTQSMKSFEQQAYQEGVQQLYAQYDYNQYVSTVRDNATVKLNTGNS